MADTAQAAIKRATLAAQREVVKLDSGALDDLEKLYRQAAADIAGRIAAYSGADGNVSLQEMQSVLAQVQARLKQLAQARDALLNRSLDAAAALGTEPFTAAAMAATSKTPPGLPLSGEGLTAAAAMRIHDEALQFVRTFIASDGLQLSDRIWRLDRHARDAVVNAIEMAVIQGHGAAQAARELLMRGQGVPGDIADKINAANAGAMGKAAGELLTGEGSPMTNAMRLMRTEINRAHGTAYASAALAHPDAAGVKFLLSPGHPKPDICDLLSTQNLHGLGSGVYPTIEASGWPAHPNTLSFLEVVFKDEVTAADRVGKETSMEALARLTPEQRKGVLGANKAEAFNDGKLTQGMIKSPWKSAQSRIEKHGMAKDTRDDLTRQYFNDRNIKISGSMRDRLLPGLLVRDDAPLLLGAPDGGTVFVKEYANRIEMELMHSWLNGPRTISIDRDGIMHWEGFFLKDGAPEGLGTRMAATSLLTASRLGLARAEVMAWGPPKYNGHYTWARLGFDAEFTQDDLAELKRVGFRAVKTVSGLMETPSGREWWKANGWQMEMGFDLDANSKSMQTLLGYLTSKGVKL